MNCLKCGREIPEDEVFCVECQLDAQRYPVKPNAAVFIPKRSAPEAPKKIPRRRSLTAEEQLNLMHRRLRAAIGIAVVSIGLLLALLYPAVSYLKEEHYEKGQNYRPITTAPPSTVPASETPKANGQ